MPVRRGLRLGAPAPTPFLPLSPLSYPGDVLGLSTHLPGASVGEPLAPPRLPRLLKRQPRGRSERAGAAMFVAHEMFERPDDETGSPPPPAPGGRHNLGGRRADPQPRLQACHGCFPLTVGQVPAGSRLQVPSRWGSASAHSGRGAEIIGSSVQPERLEQLKASRPQMEAKEPSVTFSLFWHLKFPLAQHLT